MNRTKIIAYLTLLLMVQSHCVVGQGGDRIKNFILENVSEEYLIIQEAIEDANSKFELYYGVKAPVIRLINIDNEDDLENPSVAIDKEGPEMYVHFPSEKRKTAIISYSNIGGKVSKNVDTISIDPEYKIDLMERYFLFANLYFYFYEFNAKDIEARQWHLLVSMIEVLNLEVSKDKLEKQKTPIDVSRYFSSGSYKRSWGNGKQDVPTFYIPSKDWYYSGQWKYLILNYNLDFSLNPYRDGYFFLEDKNRYLWSEYIILTTYLKEKFGSNVVREMLDAFENSGLTEFYLVTYLKEKYGYSKDFKGLSREITDWYIQNYQNN